MSGIERKTWEEFRESKLLWWTNRILHTFGWAIVCEASSSDKDVWISDIYPARVSCRGFGDDMENEGFIGLTDYLKNNIDKIRKDLD